MSNLKKLLSIASLLIFLTLVLFALPVTAKEGRPKGLEDRGPLTKITFIHYKRGNAKPDGVGKPKPSASTCYGFLAKGAKWKSTEDFEINTSGISLDDSFVQSAFDAGVNEWETYGSDAIFGTSALVNDAPYITNTVDDRNVVVFDSYSDPNVIAVTTIWGYFYGPPQSRELVEWDMLKNNSFNWGDGESNPALMDVQNIATHELGHSAGMDDLYETSCSLETMFGYSTEGDTAKRDLNTGDKTGISELYK